MKPLLVNDLDEFLERFDNFKACEFKHLEIISPVEFNISLSVQDKARGFDWISIQFLLTGITSANLLDNSKLSFIDMADGIELSHNGINFAFSILNSTFFIECESIKYQEGAF